MTNTGENNQDLSELELLCQALLALDPTGDRVASVQGDTFDQLYDGQRTGRWRYDQLHKTEKTHMGTLVEISLQREFVFRRGKCDGLSACWH